MRVLFCGNGWLPIVDAIAARRAADQFDIWDRTLALTRSVADVDVILPSNAQIDAEVIAAAAKLVLIQQPASGYEGVDLDAARTRGVPVCNAPGANTVAVAEAAAYLMLALARRAPAAARAFAEKTIGVPLGRELCGRALGLIGFGASGKALARIARGLGMTVRHVNSRSTRHDLDALLASSDVVSIHCPLTPATHAFFDRDRFAKLKPGALLINCARGPIIDRDALEEALEDGHLGGVGLDTFWHEPWDPSEPLYARDDVVTLPHVAGSTIESFDRIAEIVSENMGRVERGLSPLHRVDGI